MTADPGEARVVPDNEGYPTPGCPAQLRGCTPYHPVAGWNGYDKFQYYFITPDGTQSAPATVEIMRNSNRLGKATDFVPDVQHTPQGGEALVGGDVPDDALNFLINQANGGDFVTLTYPPGPGGTAPWPTESRDRRDQRPTGRGGQQ
jgi:hypothetical protein